VSIDTLIELYPNEWYPVKLFGLGKFAGLSNLDVLWNYEYTYFRPLEA
jgi:hypothetical protein